MKKISIVHCVVIWAMFATLFGLWQWVKSSNLQSQLAFLETELAERRAVWEATTQYLPTTRLGIFVKLPDGSFAQVEDDGSKLIRRLPGGVK